MQVNTDLALESRNTYPVVAENSEQRRSLLSEVHARLIRIIDGHVVAGQVMIDFGILAFAVVAAFIIRFERIPTGHTGRLMLMWLPILVCARLLVNWKAGVYSRMWRFFCLCDAVTIGSSLLPVTFVLLSLRVLYPEGSRFDQYMRLPFGVIALEFLVCLAALTGARVVRRILHERALKARLGPGKKCKRIVLYGAGRAGALLVKELADVPEVEIVGFVDDDPKKVGTLLSGVRVLGTGEALAKIVHASGAEEVAISMVTAGATALTSILQRCKSIPIPAKIIPGIDELLRKEARISNFRAISMSDLLGRESAAVHEFDPDVLKAYSNKRILVTGAGGSIGSELTRQLLLLQPRQIWILDKDENSIYDLEQELKFRDRNVPVEAIIADVKIPERIFAVFAEARPEVVFHAAAHKHVPLMELQPCEAVLNNIMGTENVLKACQIAGTERFVFISTDKAVNPTNIMGATKCVGENIVRHYLDGGKMKGACVRFGNVMGSRGSVVPLFMKQIEQGGPVTVTHPDIVRYFMTIPEAVQLVICAGTLANGGEVFVLDMGSPRKIVDLARQVIGLSGLRPEKDIRIVFTGLRPGEKLNEELVRPNETCWPTRFGNISAIKSARGDDQSFRKTIDSLVTAALLNNTQTVYEILASMDLGYTRAAQTIGVLKTTLFDNRADYESRARAAAA